MHSNVTLKDFLTITQYNVINIYISKLETDSYRPIIPPEDWEQYADYMVSYIGIDSPFAIYVAIEAPTDEAPTDEEESSSDVTEYTYEEPIHLLSLLNEAHRKIADLEARIKRIEDIDLAKPCQGDSND